MRSATPSFQAPADLIKPPEDLRRSPLREWARWLLAGAFVLFLAVVFVGTWLGWDLAQSRENRNLAKLPGWPRNFSDVKSFTSQAMVFYRDHFGFRNALIRAVALGKYHGLGPEVNGRIIVGKDRWLFYSKDERFLADRGLDPFSESDLDAWQELLEKRNKWFTERGIVLLVVIPPDKQTIYPEYMPEEFARLATPSRLDQLIARLKKRHSPVRLVDLRAPLFEAKKYEQVYFRTDSHWNDDGIYAAYVPLLKAIGEALPKYKFVPQSKSDFGVRTINKTGDLAQQLDLYFEYHEETRQLIRHDLLANMDAFEKLPNRPFTDGPDSSAPRLLTYNDSFTAPMIQFLAPHFSHATYSWNAWTESMDPAPVKEARPDIVINEFVERKLHNPIPIDAIEIQAEKLP
jgi:hypothetical protein